MEIEEMNILGKKAKEASLILALKTAEEKKMQRALIHFHKNENRKTVEKALAKAGKQELIPLLFSQRLHTKKGK